MRFAVLLMFSIGVMGCGGGKGSVTADKTAPQAVKTLERAMTALKRNLGQPGYQRQNDPAISQARSLIVETIPIFITERMEDEAVKEEALAKCKELEELYKKVVLDPVDGKPQDLNRAIEGVDECMPLVEELKSILGS
jgi:hypothetical protein